MDSTRDLRLTYRMVPNEQDILLGKSNIEDIGGIPFINIEYITEYFVKSLFGLNFEYTISISLFCPDRVNQEHVKYLH